MAVYTVPYIQRINTVYGVEKELTVISKEVAQFVAITPANLKQQIMHKTNTYLCVTYMRKSFADSLSTSMSNSDIFANRNFIKTWLPSYEGNHMILHIYRNANE